MRYAQIHSLGARTERIPVMARNQNLEISNTEKALIEEIKHVLERNQDEKFLRELLTRAIILEKLMK